MSEELKATEFVVTGLEKKEPEMRLLSDVPIFSYFNSDSDKFCLQKISETSVRFGDGSIEIWGSQHELHSLRLAKRVKVEF